VHASADGKLTAAYLETVLVDAEDAFSSVQGSFDSIQPPDNPAAGKLRSDLDGLLTPGADGLGELRILARQGRQGALIKTAATLAPVASGLDAFGREHGA
jgi:hypothetical protein